LATHVLNNATYASACVIVFGGGLIRTASPNAKIGVHMAFAVLNDRFVDAMDEIIVEHGVEATPLVVAMFEKIAAVGMLAQVYFILKAGVSLKLLEATTTVPHHEIFWISTDQEKSVNPINYY
tara:strand:+ start:276 stop:644 length:369 start_codon:yes stop_codon:yes gene_type:complete